MQRTPCFARKTGAIVRRLAVAAAALSIAGGDAPVRAADAEGRYALDRWGQAACADYLKDREANDKRFFAYVGWTEGYFLAFNHFQKDTYDLTPWQSTELIMAKLAKYCEQNPDRPYVTAANALAEALYPQRLRAESEIVRVQVGQQAVFLYKEVLGRINAALAALDFAVDDGARAFDERTAAALRDFQRGHGLPISGLPDQLTLNLLLP